MDFRTKLLFRLGAQKKIGSMPDAIVNELIDDPRETNKQVFGKRNSIFRWVPIPVCGAGDAVAV